MEIINSIMLERCSFCVIPAVRCKIHVISKPQNCLCQKLCNFNAIQLESMTCEEKENPTDFYRLFSYHTSLPDILLLKPFICSAFHVLGEYSGKCRENVVSPLKKTYHDLHHGWCED